MTTQHAAYPDARLNPQHLMEKIHPAIMDMPMLGDDDLKALTASIKEHGIQKPITLSHDGFVADGRNRIVAAIRAGLPSVPVIYLDASADVAAYALESAVTGRNLTRSGIVLMLYLKHPDLAQMRLSRRGGDYTSEKGTEHCDKNHNAHGKGSDSFVDVAAKYNVPREYFTRLAHIHEQCPDEDTWLTIQRSILDREASIPALVAGMAGRDATSDKKRVDPKYYKLAVEVPITLQNAFKGWGNIAWTEKYSREAALKSFFDALAVAPSEIRNVEQMVIVEGWPDHDRVTLMRKLTAWHKTHVKKQKAEKAKHAKRS